MATARAAAAAPRATGSCTPAELAWLATIPCAVLVTAAIVVLGPPLGDALLAPRGMAFLPSAQQAVLPEPTEHARYLISLSGPVLLAGIVLARARSIHDVPRMLVIAVELLIVGALVACLWVEHTTAFEPATGPAVGRRIYFTAPTLFMAGVIAVGFSIVLSRPSLRARVAATLRETPRRRVGAIAAAVLLIAVWLLTAVNSDATIGTAYGSVAANVAIWLDEAAAVLNGRPPLVDLHAQYAQLWPYVSAAAMAVLGDSITIFVASLLAGTAAAMLAVLALLRRVTASWLLAFALFAPFLATSFFNEAGPIDNRYAPVTLFSLFPLRYGAAFVLAWLTVRHLDGAAPRRRAWLFFVGGVATINNVEFGLPALGATLGALLLADRPRSWRSAVRLAGNFALGLVGAVASVAALTLAVAGSLPRFDLALSFARMFGIEGFGMLPMRIVGFHLVLYATFTAAIVAGAAQAVSDRADAALAGALVWAGVFGLGAGGYYAGRSHPDVLIGLFSAWALALVLLLVAILRNAASEARWRISPAVVALLFAFGLCVCSLAQTPTPWSQIKRLGRTAEPLLYPREQMRALAEQTSPGERVAILALVGHRSAQEVGVVDVMPFADARVVAPWQLADTVSALRASGGTKIFVQSGLLPEEAVSELSAAGFTLLREIPEANLYVMVDTQAHDG
jgi:hypothetical protein